MEHARPYWKKTLQSVFAIKFSKKSFSNANLDQAQKIHRLSVNQDMLQRVWEKLNQWFSSGVQQIYNLELASNKLVR